MAPDIPPAPEPLTYATRCELALDHYTLCLSADLLAMALVFGQAKRVRRQQLSRVWTRPGGILDHLEPERWYWVDDLAPFIGGSRQNIDAFLGSMTQLGYLRRRGTRSCYRWQRVATRHQEYV